MTTILVFGDSIAWGAYDSKPGGWVGRLEKFFKREKGSDFELFNFAVEGDITTNLLHRYGAEIKSKIEGRSNIIIIIAIGVNDSYFIRMRNDFMTAPEEFQKNIRKLILIGRYFTTKIVFVGLAPINETMTAPILLNADHAYKNVNIKRYDDILKKTCQEQKVDFIEIYDNWLKTEYKELLEDGLHPNEKGHKKLFQDVKDYLISKKII